MALSMASIELIVGIMSDVLSLRLRVVYRQFCLFLVGVVAAYSSFCIVAYRWRVHCENVYIDKETSHHF